MPTNVINLLNHEIHELYTDTRYPPSAFEYRSKFDTERVYTVNGIPVFKTVILAENQLPEPLDNTIYIVSALSLSTVPPERTDIVVPRKVERNPNGTIKGCWGFRIKE